MLENGLPVNIQKDLDALPLVVRQVIRTIPDRRYVCYASYQQQAVYAKIFVGKSAAHYASRDRAGVQLLQQAKILTPDLLLASTLRDGVYILIYAAVEDSKNVEEVWQLQDAPQRFLLMQKLVQTLAQHHRAGLLQTDLHLKNFLVQKHFVQDDLIYTLDGDGIRHFPALLHKQQRLRNLATLFSKMDVLDDCWIAELYKQYCLQLGMVVTTGAVAIVVHLTQKIRHQVVAGYADKKVFRNCTDVNVTQNFSQFLAVASGFDLSSQMVATIDQYLADTQHNIKNGNTCTIASATLANKQVIIKRYNIKGFWHGLSRALRASRAAKSWANAYRLIISNIETPQPLALLELRVRYFRRRAYYLSEYVDAPDAVQFFADTSSDAMKEAVARNIAGLFYKMYLLKFSHGDCKATNIKIVNSAPVLLDLDSMQAHFGSMFGSWFFRYKHVKDLQRLLKNWESDVEITRLLKLAFQSQYASQEAKPILIRAGMV